MKSWQAAILHGIVRNSLPFKGITYYILVLDHAKQNNPSIGIMKTKRYGPSAVHLIPSHNIHLMCPAPVVTHAQ